MVADTLFIFIFRIYKTTCNYSGNSHNHAAEAVPHSFHEHISYISSTLCSFFLKW